MISKKAMQPSRTRKMGDWRSGLCSTKITGKVNRLRKRPRCRRAFTVIDLVQGGGCSPALIATGIRLNFALLILIITQTQFLLIPRVGGPPLRPINSNNPSIIRPQGRAPTIGFCGYLSLSGNHIVNSTTPLFAGDDTPMPIIFHHPAFILKNNAAVTGTKNVQQFGTNLQHASGQSNSS